MRLYDAKKERDVAKYKLHFFEKELNKKREQYAGWKANQKKNAENRGLRYMTYEAMYDDYIIGAIDKTEFFRQRRIYNLLIADNVHRAEKIAWLEKETERYRREYEACEALYKEAQRREKKKENERYVRKKNGIKRRTYDITKPISKYNMPKYMKEELKRKEAEAKRKKKEKKNDQAD